jgi:hypothetical protein
MYSAQGMQETIRNELEGGERYDITIEMRWARERCATRSDV